MNDRRRVMLVEDSPTQAERLRTLLTSEGFDVVATASAEAALETLQAARPDAIVLDYHLPGMNGDEFCREIRLNVNTRAIPVLMLTVESSSASQTRGLESGADDYVAKSADADILIARLRTLLRKSEGASAIVEREGFFRRARILVIDHSPTYLHYLLQELTAEHYAVEGASTASRGLELVRGSSFDCVIAETAMPGVDPIGLCRQLGESNRSVRPPIVVLLGPAEDKELMAQCLQAGADEYLVKSADLALFRARIRSLLRRKFMVEENQRILDGLRQKELEAVRARAEKEASEVRAMMADQLADANRELEQANRKLQESLEITRAITDNAADALFLLDAQGRVTFVNPAAEKMFGFGREELLGVRLSDKIRRAGECTRSAVDRALTTLAPVTDCEGVYYRKDGEPVDVACSAAPVLNNGRAVAAVLVLHDVTERKRVAERLRERQKLESLGLLAGGIAHDFNNLLVGVLGNASLAIEMLPEGHPAAGVFDRIMKSAEVAANLTRQMLAYAGKGRFVIEPVDLSRLAEDVMPLIQTSIPSRVTVERRLDPHLPPIMADRGQLHQVFTNLVINAAEAIGEAQGAITIETGVSERTPSEDPPLEAGRYVFLKVTDTGAGMDAATQAKIFDPFFSTKFTGRGLGLAAVAGIVRGHKGAIEVVTMPGAGSSFLVLLPAAKEQPRPAAEPRRLEDHSQQSGAILVIDDETTVRQLMKTALERRGYEVLSAESGGDAVELLRGNRDRISVAVLDLGMPGQSGPETMPELLAVKPELDIVVSSGYGEAESMQMFNGMRVAAFIQKPYTAGQLAETVRSVMDRKRG